MLALLRRLFRRKLDIEPVALVALDTTPRILSPSQIAMAVSRATDRPFPENLIREDQPGRHRFVVEGYELTLLTRHGPYIPKDREPSRDLRSQDVIERHEAAVLLDCWAAPAGHERVEGTDLMGKILVELFDENSIGVYCFHSQRLYPVNDEIETMFREGNAWEAMQGMVSSSVSAVHADDLRMQAAIEEARRRWPEFLAAFGERRAAKAWYGVKAPFSHGDDIEHLWIEVSEADAESVTGTVTSRPLALPRPRQGERVTLPVTEISDWSYQDEERTGGSFTHAIVQESLGL